MRTTNVRDVDSLYHDALRVCNDSLRTDACLLYYPHIIAMASILVAAVWSNREQDKEVTSWLVDFSVDFERVFEVVKLMMDLYKLVKTYDENRQIDDLLKRLPRPQLQSSLRDQMHMKLEQKF